jgi:hypothetical protein
LSTARSPSDGARVAALTARGGPSDGAHPADVGGRWDGFAMDETTVPLSAAQVIDAYWTSDAPLLHPPWRDPAERVRRHLDTYLDTEAERYLTTGERTLVDAERQLDPAGAVARVTGPEALVAALPGFLDAAWVMPGPADARAQLRVVGGLVRWIVDRGLVAQEGMACDLLEVEVSLAHAAEVVRERSRTDLGP